MMHERELSVLSFRYSAKIEKEISMKMEKVGKKRGILGRLLMVSTLLGLTQLPTFASNYLFVQDARYYIGDEKRVCGLITGFKSQSENNQLEILFEQQNQRPQFIVEVQNLKKEVAVEDIETLQQHLGAEACIFGIIREREGIPMISTPSFESLEIIRYL